jgi:DNA-binding Lrp family transcriptional regulator
MRMRRTRCRLGVPAAVVSYRQMNAARSPEVIRAPSCAAQTGHAAVRVPVELHDLTALSGTASAAAGRSRSGRPRPKVIPRRRSLRCQLSRPPSAANVQLIHQVDCQLPVSVTSHPAISAHYTTGDGDILVHVAAKNPRDLYRITTAILAIDGVTRTNTVISLDEAISYRPHALLRVAAGTWRPPVQPKTRP